VRGKTKKCWWLERRSWSGRRIEDPNLDEALLAYAMNGEALSVPHGFPLRLVVPGWYAVTSIKWLTEIALIEEPFGGFFQANRYHYQWNREGRVVSEPVDLQRVRALITEPNSDQPVPRGDLTIRGAAWSGAAGIAEVEVGVGKGDWQAARIGSAPVRGSWCRWELITHLDQPGVGTVSARASDLAGATQPERAEWIGSATATTPSRECRFGWSEKRNSHLERTSGQKDWPHDGPGLFETRWRASQAASKDLRRGRPSRSKRPKRVWL